MKTKINKIVAIAIITAMSTGLLSITTSYATTKIGTGSVVGTSSFDSNIDWDDTFGNTSNASGSVDNVVVTATVVPSLNMEISTGAIDLGSLQAGVEVTGELDLEVGTNAANGLTITARSSSGGLTNVSDNSVQLNSLTADGVAESYKFVSAINATTDSSVSGFTQAATLSTEVNNNSTEHTVYTSNKPQATNGVNDVTFSVKATSDAQTPAGLYEDRITFTVTGNF
jgi:hypothetical protein